MYSVIVVFILNTYNKLLYSLLAIKGLFDVTKYFSTKPL